MSAVKHNDVNVPFRFQGLKHPSSQLPEKYQPAWGTIPPSPRTGRSRGGDHPSTKDSISLLQSFASTGYQPRGRFRFRLVMTHLTTRIAHSAESIAPSVINIIESRVPDHQIRNPKSATRNYSYSFQRRHAQETKDTGHHPLEGSHQAESK